MTRISLLRPSAGFAPASGRDFGWNHRFLVLEGQVRAEAFGKTLQVPPAFDAGVVPDIKKWFESNYTIQFANYPVDERYLDHGGTLVECRP